MSTPVSAARNYVNDKNNTIPITSSYIDADNTRDVNALNRKVVVQASAPSSPTAGDTWVDTTNGLVKWYNGATWINIGQASLLTNSSGSQRSAGDVVVVYTSGNSAFTTTTTANDETVMGVVLETIANGATGYVQTSGICAVTVDGSTTRGQFLSASGTAAKATPSTLAQPGTFAVALTASASSVTALLTGVSHVPAGTVVQVVQANVTSVVTCNSSIPIDNTIPQNTEGVEVVTATITPKSTTNKLLIMFSAMGSVSSASLGGNAALFQDSTANALAAGGGGDPRDSGIPFSTVLMHYMAAGTTSATTFKIRCGVTNGAGSFYINGNGSGTRLYGGVDSCQLIIMEIKA